MIIVTIGGNMSPDSGWWSHMTHSAGKATNLHTYADTQRQLQTHNTHKKSPHRHPLTLSFCGAVSPIPDRVEKLVNIVVGENRVNKREIMGEGQQGK